MVKGLRAMRLVTVAAIGAAALIPTLAHAVECPQGALTGTVTHVRDGDTIEVGELPIRLSGVSAPEDSPPRRVDPGGIEATAWMVERVMGQAVTYVLDGTDTYDRCAGECSRDGSDISEELIAAGLALNCPRYNRGDPERNDRYEAAETAGAAVAAVVMDGYEAPRYCSR